MALLLRCWLPIYFPFFGFNINREYSQSIVFIRVYMGGLLNFTLLNLHALFFLWKEGSLFYLFVFSFLSLFIILALICFHFGFLLRAFIRLVSPLFAVKTAGNRSGAPFSGSCRLAGTPSRCVTFVGSLQARCKFRCLR